jgi:hypothetical protein
MKPWKKCKICGMLSRNDYVCSLECLAKHNTKVVTEQHARKRSEKGDQGQAEVEEVKGAGQGVVGH